MDSALAPYQHTLAETGILVLRRFFDADTIAACVNESHRLWQAQTDKVPQNLRLGLRTDGAGDTVLDRLDPVADISTVFKALNEHPALLSVIEQLLSEQALVMKEKLIYKAPGTAGFGAHRDAPYFASSGVPAAQTLSVAIALEAANSANGKIRFFPQLRDTELAADPQEPRDIDAQALAARPAVAPDLAPGDIVIYDARVPHCSARNTSARSRLTYIVTYTPASYPHSRAQYYQARLEEQTAERQGHIPGPFYLT